MAVTIVEVSCGLVFCRKQLLVEARNRRRILRLTYSIVVKLAVIVLEGTRRVFRELSFGSGIVLYNVRMGHDIVSLNLLTPSSCQLSSRLTRGTTA